MGYSYEGSIKKYWPDDTDTEMYLTDSNTMEEIRDRIETKWGGDSKMSDFTLFPIHIHTNCLTYDLHDPSDYTTFLLITKKA